MSPSSVAKPSTPGYMPPEFDGDSVARRRWWRPDRQKSACRTQRESGHRHLRYGVIVSVTYRGAFKELPTR